MKIFEKNKGFTLIELIVIISIIGVLVLLAIPKFMGYTQKAKLTEIKSNIRQLENASERYYINTEEWPRLEAEPYTAEQVEAFAKEIKNKTGQVINLDPLGKYYDIDYVKLQKYVQKPKDGINYIIQNPVGEIYYLEDLTRSGKGRFDTNNKPTAIISMNPEQNINSDTTISWDYKNSTDDDGNDIVDAQWEGKSDNYSPGTHTVRLRVKDSKGEWSDWTEKTFEVISLPSFVSKPGLENIFDKDENTYASSTGFIDIDLQKDLTNRILSITMAVGSSWTGDGFQGYLEVLNSSGLPISYMNADNDIMQTDIKVMATSPQTASKRTINIIVPQNASKIRVRAASTYSTVYFYELKEYPDQILPKAVNNLTYISSDSSVTLNWKSEDSDYGKVAIYQDGKFLSYATGNTFTTQTVLYSNMSYMYEIRTIDTTGNRSLTNSNIITTTRTEPITWRGGIDGSIFDGDLNTYTSSSAIVGQTATWLENIEGRSISVSMGMYSFYSGAGFEGYLEVLDSSGKAMDFIDNSIGSSVTSIKTIATKTVTKQTYQIVVPVGAKGIRVRPASEYSTAYIYEISASSDLQLPNPVSNLKYTSTDSSITLSWTPIDDDYEKVAIYQDGKFLTYATGNTFSTQTILYSNKNYKYDVITLDTSGNRSLEPSTIMATTKTEPITWRGGIDGSIFDGNLNTYTSTSAIAGQTATWIENIEGRTISVTMGVYSFYSGSGFEGYLEVLNNSGNPITFINSSTGATVTNIKVMATKPVGKQTFRIVIPAGATGIRVRPASTYSTAYIYEIQEN